MRYEDVHIDRDMLEYILEGTLSTLEKYSTMKRPPSGEIKRQCDIADKINRHISDAPLRPDSKRLNMLSVGCSALEYYNSLIK